jgi:ligand-binding sensor domain-containing protein
MTDSSYIRKITLTLLAVLALSFSTRTRAQQLQASLSHYSTDDGLPSNTIANIVSDDFGYIWLATWNGVSRFDGFNFYNYKTGNASGIKGMHNRLDNMTVDQSQNIWLKMYDGRIFVINRLTDRIEDPLEGIDGHEDFHIDYFFNPYVTSSGDVLVSMQNVGLYKLRLNRSGFKQDLILTRNLTVNCVVEGYHGDIWAGTQKGVRRIDMANLALENEGYLMDEHIAKLTTNGYNIFVGTKSGKIMKFSYGQEPKLVKDIGREITGLYIDSHGLLWFSDTGDGAYRLKPETGDVKFFNQRLFNPEFTSRGAEFGEAMGMVWVRMNHGGYGYYNRDADEVEYFHNDPSNPWNLSNSVNARLELDNGVVWESTIRRGLEKLEVLKKTIARIQLVSNAVSPLENETRALYYDKTRRHLLVGNKKGTLFIIKDDGSRQAITHDSNGKPFSRFYGISQDAKGNYWLCDKDNGVYKMTPNGNGGYTIVNFCHEKNNPWSLSSNSAYQTVEDMDGNIWVATYGGGVNILVKGKDGSFKAYHRNNELRKLPQNKYLRVRTIAIDKEGKVWAGTTDGILIMTMKNGKLEVEKLETPENMSKGLMSNDIVCLARSPKGDMWVGTNSGGLSHTTEKDDNGTWQFENYGIEQGLPSEEITSLTFDSKGNVWFSTDHILCSFDVNKHIFSTFSNLDGVDDTMCSEGAAIVLPDDNVIFGTLDGYYLVDRSKLITKTGSLLRLRITDFELNGEKQTPRLNNTFQYYVPESKRVMLPSNDCVFSFRFAALNYQLQHRIHYQYKLNGYDEDWQNAGRERTATYSRVPAGTYHFQVKAFLLESPDNFDMRTIEVVVPPIFLFSTTAVWIYMVILAIAAIALLLWYQERLRKQYLSSGHMEKEEEEPKEDTFDDETPIDLNDEQEITDRYEIIEE